MRLWRKSGSADQGAVDAEDGRIVFTRTNAEMTVTVTGRVTIDSSPYLRTVLLRLLKKPSITGISIDLSGVSYIDTSAIATLLEALKEAQRRSIKLRLVGVTGQVRMLAEITELPAIFEATGSEVVIS